MLPAPSRARVEPRPAARHGVAVRRGGDPEHRGRVHHVLAAQARTGWRVTDRDGPRHRLSPGRRVTPRANPEAALVRRVRLRLLAWSGGTPLAVLLLLGSVISLAVANSLAAAGAEQLRARATFVSAGLRLPFEVPVAGTAAGPVTSIAGGAGPGGLVAFD